MFAAIGIEIFPPGFCDFQATNSIPSETIGHLSIGGRVLNLRAIYSSLLQFIAFHGSITQFVVVYQNQLQLIAIYRSLSQFIVIYRNLSQLIAHHAFSRGHGFNSNAIWSCYS